MPTDGLPNPETSGNPFRDDLVELERERAVYRAQMENSGKPPAVVEKIVAWRMEKYFSEACLLEQPFVKKTADGAEVTVKEHVAAVATQLQDTLDIRRFVRFQVGEAFAEQPREQVAAAAREFIASIRAAPCSRCSTRSPVASPPR